MNLDKIGKFIASKRKENSLTQEQLADKLNITDKAVSKWERGLSLPDASIMLDLCSILGINVNELLSGEMIKEENYSEKSEKLLVDLKKIDEEKNKKLLLTMLVLMISSVIFYIGIILVSVTSVKDNTLLGTIIVISTVLLTLVSFFALRLEQKAGYYECRKCHNQFIPTYKEMLITGNCLTRRYLKCPKCNKRSWTKKIMKRD